jgi:hypothetical protein
MDPNTPAPTIAISMDITLPSFKVRNGYIRAKPLMKYSN